MSRALVPYQSPPIAPNVVKTALSELKMPCWERVGNVLGRRANRQKVILPSHVREMLEVTLEQMGVLVAAIMTATGPNPHAPYHRSTVWHWEHSTRKRQLMPTAVCAVYRQIIRECVRIASGGRYVAQVANVRLWRVTLRRVA